MYRVIVEYKDGSINELYFTSATEAYGYLEEAFNNGDDAFVEFVE